MARRADHFRQPTGRATRDTLCVARGCQRRRCLQPGQAAVGSRDRVALARVRGLAHRRGVPGHREGARRLKTAELPWAGWLAAACGGADMGGLGSSATAGPERIGGERPAQPARALPGPAGAWGGGGRQRQRADAGNRGWNAPDRGRQRGQDLIWPMTCTDRGGPVPTAPDRHRQSGGEGSRCRDKPLGGGLVPGPKGWGRRSGEK